MCNFPTAFIIWSTYQLKQARNNDALFAFNFLISSYSKIHKRFLQIIKFLKVQKLHIVNFNYRKCLQTEVREIQSLVMSKLWSADHSIAIAYHCVQNGSGVHPTSCQMGTRGSLPGSKASGT